MIAGEGSAARVGSVKARCEADDDQPRLRIAERRDWCAVVIGMFLAAVGEKPREPRAIRAGSIEDDAVGGPELVSHQLILAGALPRSYARALWNCPSSVEPFIAVTDDLPAVTVCVTSSK